MVLICFIILKIFQKLIIYFFTVNIGKKNMIIQLTQKQILKCYGNYQFNNEIIFNRNEILKKI